MKLKTLFASRVLRFTACLFFAGTVLSPAGAEAGGRESDNLPASDRFVAHEWGTFTSVQGANGELISWNPFVRGELPDFVYDRTKGTANRAGSKDLNLQKFNLWALQRMETPVIYFYSDRERAVNVSVDFPEGTITEWYPNVTEFGPRFSANPLETERRSFVEWNNLRISPLRLDPESSQALPIGARGSHYFAARATDSDFVRATNSVKTMKSPEREKFLFYRGLGSFKSPLRVELPSENELVLRNATSETLPDLFVLTMRGGKGHFSRIGNLGQGETRSIPLNPAAENQPASDLVAQLSYAMRQALVVQGLYAREADAMVETWKNSWFAETGVRVLYTVPGAWTDRVLPLRIKPQPQQVARVFVGRAEVITPGAEWDLMQQIVRFGDEDADTRARAIVAARNLDLGRFAGAAISRILGQHPSEAFRKRAMELQAVLSSANTVEALTRR